MSGVSPGSGGPGEVKRNSHVSLVSGGKEDSAMQSSENLRPGLNITPHHTRPDTVDISYTVVGEGSNKRNKDLGEFLGG